MQGELLASFEMRFQTLVSRLESELLVKLHCAGTRLVRCELHYATTTFAAATNGPLNQLRAEAAASATGRNSDGFNQPSRATFVRQIRQNCELEGTDQLSVVLHHDQLVIVVSIDRFERIVIALRERRFESFASGSQRVICKESHYVGHVLTDRAADLTHGSLYPNS